MSYGYETLDVPHWVYRQWSADGRLLYIGVTARPGRRAQQHVWNTAWYHEIDRVDLTEYADGPTAYAAERDAIRSELPKYNLKYNPANAGIKFPPNTGWKVGTATFSRMIWEAVNKAEAAA